MRKALKLTFNYDYRIEEIHEKTGFDDLASGYSLLEYFDKACVDRLAYEEDLSTLVYKGERFMASIRRYDQYYELVLKSDGGLEAGMHLEAIRRGSDPIALVDVEGNFLFMSQAYQKLFGLEGSEPWTVQRMLKSNIINRSVFLEIQKKRSTTSIEQTLQSGETIITTGKPIFDDDGRLKFIYVQSNKEDSFEKTKASLERLGPVNLRYQEGLEAVNLEATKSKNIIYNDPKMADVLRLAKRVAPVSSTVLILGETGVGKEEIAKFVHFHSDRKKAPFIKVNCGALPENLIESELFGYVKGSFTGANEEGKEGLFKIADGGTIFLDEIAELPLNLQVKLLRVLQEGEIKPIGATKTEAVDVRVLAATHRDLEGQVKAGHFREDLYYRLHIIPIEVPPIRERKKDVYPLVQHFLDGLNRRYSENKIISSRCMDLLCNYDWPGNVRQIQNIVERLFVISPSSLIGADDLPDDLEIEEPRGVQIMDIRKAVGQLEAEMLDKAYEEHGNVRDAARALGIDASTFVRKRSKYEKLNLL